MHYTVKPDTKDEPLRRKSAKSALRAAHEFISQGAKAVAIHDPQGKEITLAELANLAETDY